MVPITGGTGAAGAAVDVLLAVRRTPPSGCWPREGPTSRPRPAVHSPMATNAREEMTIGTTPFLPLVAVGLSAGAGSGSGSRQAGPPEGEESVSLPWHLSRYRGLHDRARGRGG